MRCPKCKTENPDNISFCKSCQEPLNNRNKICPNGHNYESRYDSCPHCPKSPSSEETVLDGFQRPSPRKFDETEVDDGKVKLNPAANKAGKPVSSQPAIDSDRTMIFSDVEKQPADKDDNPPSASGQGQAIPQYAPRKLVGWLVTFDIDPIGIDYKLTAGRQRIGRDPRCEIVINDPAISSEHAVILYRDGQVIIEDKLSANGTFVNDEMIEDKKKLYDNDIIRLGTLQFKLKII